MRFNRSRVSWFSLIDSLDAKLEAFRIRRRLNRWGERHSPISLLLLLIRTGEGLGVMFA